MPRGKKRSNIAKLKAKAWKLCSLYVRLKDANESGFIKCYTCDTKPMYRHWKEMQAGHFIGGRGQSILFDTRGIRSQCVGCNLFNGGRPVEFMINLEQELGIDKARKLRDELVLASKQPRTITLQEYEDMIIDFQKKIDQILYEKGLSL